MKTSGIMTMALLLGSLVGCGSDSNSNGTDKCAAVTCGSGQFCDGATGMCRTADRCLGVTCGSGMACDGATGMCVALNTCAAVSCSNGQICDASTAACVNPPFPTLGVQIDRMGRPAVNTALTNPFDLYGPGGNAESSDTTKARYNGDSNIATWNATWGSGADKTGRTGPMGLHMGIIDGLDGTCANQFAYGLGTALGFSKYGLLNFVLANDVLHVDSTQGTCAITAGAGYLSVEIATATGGTNADCGGRRLEHDVIDITYSALALNNTMGVSDGIVQTTVPTATFPFMQPAP